MLKYLAPVGGMVDKRFGVLATWRHRGVPAGVRAGLPWAADNGAFTRCFDADRFLAWLTEMRPFQSTCLFVAAPDVYADAGGTLAAFDVWERQLRGWPLAYVAQDGQEDLDFPEPAGWHVLFVGGSTGWKLSPAAVTVIRRAQALGKGVHVGRVNYRQRYRYFRRLSESEEEMTSGPVMEPAPALRESSGRLRLGRRIWRSLRRRSTSLCVCIYLGAVVAANASVLLWGPAASILNAFLLVGLDLATRDALHEAWSGSAHSRWTLPRNMALLIAAGGMLSWLLNRDAGRIAISSFAAFSAAGVADTVAYQGLRRAPYAVRANGSNLAAGLVDSLVFPYLAFGAFLPAVVFGQWAAKAGGGALWAWAIGRWRERQA